MTRIRIRLFFVILGALGFQGCASPETDAAAKVLPAEVLKAECPQPVSSTVIEREFANGVTLLAVKMPEMTVLDLFRLVSNGNGSSVIEPFPLLPNGGIDGKHLCAKVDMNRLSVPKISPNWRTEANVTLFRSGLLLSSGVDYAAAYPAAYPAIRAVSQIEVLPSADYLVLRWAGQVPDFKSQEFVEAMAALLVRYPQHCDRFSISMLGSVMIPVCK